MTFNRSDFSYTATASGYQIQYKGQNIGGAGTLQPYKGRKRAQQAAEYLASALRQITAIVDGRGPKYMLDEIARIDNPAPPSIKPARFISFDSGVVCSAHNEGSWADPLVQLTDRVLNMGCGAKMLDADYQVIAAMTYLDAVARQIKAAAVAETAATDTPAVAGGASTAWEAITTSDALYPYARSSHRVWSRLADGDLIFTVLPVNETPGAGDGSYASIAAALKVKGLLH